MEFLLEFIKQQYVTIPRTLVSNASFDFSCLSRNAVYSVFHYITAFYFTRAPRYGRNKQIKY